MEFPECAPYRKNGTDVSETDRMFKDPEGFLKGVLRNNDYSHIVMHCYLANATASVIAKYNYIKLKEIYHSIKEVTPYGPKYNTHYLIYGKSSS